MTGLQTTVLGQHLRILTPLFLWLAPLGFVAGAVAALRALRRQQQISALCLRRASPACSRAREQARASRAAC
jgi:hypothetical protein